MDILNRIYWGNTLEKTTVSSNLIDHALPDLIGRGGVLGFRRRQRL